MDIDIIDVFDGYFAVYVASSRGMFFLALAVPLLCVVSLSVAVFT